MRGRVRALEEAVRDDPCPKCGGGDGRITLLPMRLDTDAPHPEPHPEPCPACGAAPRLIRLRPIRLDGGREAVKRCVRELERAAGETGRTPAHEAVAAVEDAMDRGAPAGELDALERRMMDLIGKQLAEGGPCPEPSLQPKVG